jgi:hypothetical protein
MDTTSPADDVDAILAETEEGVGTDDTLDVDALLAELPKEAQPAHVPEAFDDPSGREVWSRLSEHFPTDAALAEAFGDVPGLGTGADLRANIGFAGLAVRELLSAELERALGDRIGDPALIALAARIGRAMAGNRREFGNAMPETASAAAPPVDQQTMDKIDQAIDRIYAQHAGKASMNSDRVQRQLQRLFAAKSGGGRVEIAHGPRVS